MRQKVTMFEKSKNINIKNTSVRVEVGSIKQVETVNQDKLDLLFDTVSLNAILNAGGRADEVRCYPGTREELIGKIERWMDGQGEVGHRVLWLSGPAGAGKSAIAQTLAERAAERRVHAANFFFFRGDNTRNHALPLVATILYQLVDFYPTLLEQLSDCLTEKPLMHKASVGEQFARLLAATIKNIHHSSSIGRKIILIIDGLDECDDEGTQVRIVGALHALVTRDNSPFRVMVASRVEPHLVMLFNKIGGSVESIFLDDEYRPEDDIRKFVAAKFNEIKQMHHLAHTLNSDWPTKIDIDKITSKSSGQFIYGATVMRFIEYSKDSPALSLLTVHQIRPPTNHSPFAQLDALYSHVFSKARDIRAIKWAIGFNFMHLYSNGKNMLRMAGYEILDLQSLFTDVSAIAQISIDQNGRLDVYFYHASLPDYLKEKSRSGIYHTDEGEIAADASTICLQKFHDAESFRSVSFIAAEVKTPTTELSKYLLDASKRKIEGGLFIEKSSSWKRLIHAIIRLYFTTDIALFETMLRNWLRFASIHEINTSQVEYKPQYQQAKAAYTYYEWYRVTEKAKFAFGRGLIK